MRAFVYILSCDGGTLYTGITKNIASRLLTHISRGKNAAKYTKSHPVSHVAALFCGSDYSAAARLECKIKKLKRTDKDSLIANPDSWLLNNADSDGEKTFSAVSPEKIADYLARESTEPFYKAGERAYAKINLDLYVTEKREDGFHNLSTHMVKTSLYDSVSVSLKTANVTDIRIVTDGDLPTDRHNLAYLAAERYLSAICESASVTVKIRKRIPLSAGLGGGSSDAAAVLRLMQRAYGSRLSECELQKVALSLGSDVPFCLTGKSARCTGRGEVMEERPLGKPLYAVIVKGDESVSTPDAFRRIDAYYDGNKKYTYAGGALDSLLREGKYSAIAEKMHNDFENVILPLCPKASFYREILPQYGAFVARMSGSGPSVFGLFFRKKAAIEAAKRLGNTAYAVRIL